MIVFAASVMTVLLAILCLLGSLGCRLYKIHTTLDLIHQDLVRGFGLSARKQETQKKRIYYFDENGQRRWRKNND